MKKKPAEHKLNDETLEDLYYDAMELLDDSGAAGAKKAENLLLKAIKSDPHRVQPYIGLAHVYGTTRNKQEAEKAILKAYEETINQFPVWPDEMEWGYIENRPYMRATQSRADLYADKGMKEEAIELYRLLLRLNPNDNQGIRYLVAGIYAGKSGDEINDMFDEGNEKQNWDALETLVATQNAEHHFWEVPEE